MLVFFPMQSKDKAADNTMGIPEGYAFAYQVVRCIRGIGKSVHGTFSITALLKRIVFTIPLKEPGSFLPYQ